MDEAESAEYLARMRTGGGLAVSKALQAEHFPKEHVLLGRTISGYEICGHIADGGMSRVYRARRVDGRFDREVAVKVSPASVLDQTLRERFVQEQKILASLNHPFIAQLYDAGISAEGWPYIVMELIEGVPIDEYCASLVLEEKLNLLTNVCSALSFAHTQLVVHRDIKPGNVLVTADGVPKLLDFGIAKLLSASSQMTQIASLTPRYASPEQLLGEAAGVASDVYQVGLLLAEILNPDLIEPPDSLSDALQRASSSAPQNLNSKVVPLLPRELISIVEQCIRSNPADRYAELSEVRDDLSRYLKGYPVEASGNTRRYRSSKFVRRNWLVLTSSAAVLLSFILSGAWYLREVDNARQRAELEADTSREVTEFLTDLFRSTAPSELRGEEVTATQLLARGVERIDEDLGDQPRVHAQVQAALGRVYLDLGQYELAENLLYEAIRVQREELGEAHPATLRTFTSIAGLAAGKGALAEAEALYKEIIDLYTQTPGYDQKTTLSLRSALAGILRQRGQFTEATEMQNGIVEDYRANKLLETSEGIAALSRLAISTIQAGDAQTAIPYFEQTLHLSRAVLGENDPQTLNAINNMAVTYQETGQPELALPYSEDGYNLAVKIYGREHHRAVRSAVNHSNTLRQIGRLEDARRYATTAYETALASLPRSHAATDQALTEMGQIELASNNFPRAEALFRELLDIEFEHLGETHMYTIGTQLKLANAVAEQDRIEEATVLVADAVANMHTTQGAEHHETMLAEKQLAGLYMRAERFEDARLVLARVLSGLTGHLGADARQVLEVNEMLSEINTQIEKRDS